MAARASMAQLIALLRVKVNDTGSAIWTDDQLEDYLDMHRAHIRRELLSKEVDEKQFWSTYELLEGVAATWDDDATIIKMWDSDASAATAVTPDDFNLIDGSFGFDDAQSGSYYLDARTHDLHGAIAECMEQLAMDSTKAKQWSRGGVSYTQYDFMEMGKYHRNLGSGLKTTNVTKTYRK